MYGKNWDQYYIRTYRLQKTKALWDVPVEQAIELDHKRFKKYLSEDLPIIDIGCGTGTQSRYLLQYFTNVLGVDVAAEAIRVAKENYQLPGLVFDTFDVTDVDKAKSIEKKLGPSNIYMRGVLHQILEADLDHFRESIRTLLGATGTMYCIEVSDQIRAHFSTENQQFSRLPERLKQVFISNLPPKGVSLESLPSFFPISDFNILQAGVGSLNTNLKYPDGNPIFIPATYCMVRKVGED